MKITKAKLKQIIKEELEAVTEVAQFEGGPEVDIQDAIQMLEADFNEHDEVGAGTLYHVINRLQAALDKLEAGHGEKKLKEGKFPFPDGTTRDYDWKVDAEIGDKLVNAVLDLQELRGDAYVVKMLREMANDIEKEMAAKDGPAMQEGRLGDMISAGIGKILELPSALMLGGLIVYLNTTAPRDDIDLIELSKDTKAMAAFGNKLASPDYNGKQFALDWHELSRDEIMSKYFSGNEDGPFRA